jgi:hypothetical protein
MVCETYRDSYKQKAKTSARPGDQDGSDGGKALDWKFQSGFFLGGPKSRAEARGGGGRKKTRVINIILTKHY